MSNAERFRCFACGRFTDELTDEGPTAEEAGQSHRWTTGVLDVHEQGGPCRAAVVCWPCFWKTDPDMWIHPSGWQALQPILPLERLLLIPDDHSAPGVWNPASYPWPL
jgi:hypothetical protein